MTEARLKISIFNGSGSTDYLHGFVAGLNSLESVSVNVIDSDKSAGLFDNMRNVRFLNLIGSVRHDVSLREKVARVLRCYARTLVYAWRTDSPIFHIQWLCKLEYIDRVLLPVYYKLLGRRLVFTAHNIDLQRRSGRSTLINRLSLRFMYRMMDRIIVHSESMRRDLMDWFDVPAHRIRTLPMGVLEHLPCRGASRAEARRTLGLDPDRKILLFFGSLRPDKGLDVLVEALAILRRDVPDAMVVVAGSGLGHARHVAAVRKAVRDRGLHDHVRLDDSYIADDDVENYFVSADCVVLPYRRIFQSAVLLTAFRFGIPVVASAVGGVAETIEEGKTGFLCNPDNPQSLAVALRCYFESSLYRDLESTRKRIAEYTKDRFDWKSIAKDTVVMYRELDSS